ncbi:hypothetical protein BP5796_04708 [Coleophoma crateriformis]|uniref:N-acetyltransferase domain-containing protein n=1 Tax=Coleophoma crateriformis TaxID=565419 RepID=A0A3D8SA40_9HELO|nr:hypothetical protein BP5796_04708 [Coleophoma crateriformis]
MADLANVPPDSSGHVSMWADPAWKPGMNFTEWRRAQPQYLKDVPYNMQAAPKKTVGSKSPPTPLSIKTKPGGYLPPHLRGPCSSSGPDAKQETMPLPPHLRGRESKTPSVRQNSIPSQLRAVDSGNPKSQQVAQDPTLANNSSSTGPSIAETYDTISTIPQGTSITRTQVKPITMPSTLTTPNAQPSQHLQEQAFLESVGLLPRMSNTPPHLRGIENEPRHAPPKQMLSASTLDLSSQSFRLPQSSKKPHTLKPFLQEEALNRLIAQTGLPFHDPKRLSQMMIEELNNSSSKDNRKIDSAQAPAPSGPLAEKSRISIPSNISLSGRVSDAGIVESEKSRSALYPLRENIRARQGIDARELFLDWDGKTWMPPPVDWENDRGTFDDSFIPEYCKEWALGVEGSGQITNISGEGFRSGTHPINNGKLADPMPQPESHPDLRNCENEEKRRMQTAETESFRAKKRLEKRLRSQIVHQETSLPPYEPAQLVFPESNRYKPLIDIYLRPATNKDVSGMTAIFNHYAEEGILTEDQGPIVESVIRKLLSILEEENAPIVVAIKGHLPEPRFQRGKKTIILPQFELVVGFVFLRRHEYTLNDGDMGRSRYTSNLNIYVHPEYTRKGVGRSLMDRIFQCASATYSAKDGYDWYNPSEHPVYKSGGGRQCHQIVANYMTFNGDPNLEWVQKLLEEFSFKKVGTIESAGRSAPCARELKWLDAVIFQARASRAIEIYN